MVVDNGEDILTLKTVDLCLDGETLVDAELVAGYLNSCPILYVAAGLAADPLLDGKIVVPIGCASDGVFIWPLSVGYFVSQHGLGVNDDLLLHIRNNKYAAPKLTAEEVDALRMSI